MKIHSQVRTKNNRENFSVFASFSPMITFFYLHDIHMSAKGQAGVLTNRIIK
jgi:hypothetical protein